MTEESESEREVVTMHVAQGEMAIKSHACCVVLTLESGAELLFRYLLPLR